jgi:hypothetical protein
VAVDSTPSGVPGAVAQVPDSLTTLAAAPESALADSPAATARPATLFGEAMASGAAYDRTIRELRLLVDQRRADLDPVTVAVIEKSLTTIDLAIGDARRALLRDPASPFLTEQLNRALEKKVEILRTVALLPARS